MKKYLIIRKNGKIEKVENYLKSENQDKRFVKYIQAKLNSNQNSSQESKIGELGKKFGFNWEQNAPPGFLNYDYQANLMMRLIKKYARKLVRDIGFPIYEVRGSNVFDQKYPVVEAYAKLYGERLFNYKLGKHNVIMSYDASYPQFNLAAKYNLSYKNLPFAHFSISDCYRNEQSGECMKLYRNKRFFMPDLHPYFKNLEQAFKWYPKIEEQIEKASVLKYNQVIAVSSPKYWEKYKNYIIKICQGKRDSLLEIDLSPKEKYWIINVDYEIVDQLGQAREIACIQIDIGNAKKLGIEYINEDSQAINPIIIHSAVPGGLERYLYMALDKFPKSFPLWLYPIQLRIIPVGEEYIKSAENFAKQYLKKVRYDIDDRALSVSHKIKYAKDNLIPNLIVWGKKEENKKGNYRKVIQLKEEIKKENKVFINRDWPAKLDERIKIS